MPHPLRILSIEDDPNDTKLIQDLLETEGIDCEVTRVDTEAALLASFEQGRIDLILADYTLPSFDGISALKLAMKACPDVPFLFVSGTLGEEVAIEALKIGATDFVLKTRLSRLVPSVLRALREATQRAERKRAEESLRKSETYLAEAQRLSRTGSFGWNVSCGEIYWSEETYKIFEYDRAIKPTLEMIALRTHPEDRDRVQQVLDDAAHRGTKFDTEHRLLMPDGAVKHLHVVAHTLKDSSGNVEFVGAVTDITREKQAEEALRKSEEQWRDVFEHNPTMYFMVNAAGHIMAINPFGAEQLGYSIAELIGQSVMSVFSDSEREAVQQNLSECLAHLGKARNWEACKLRKDGTELRVRETAKAVARESGPIILIASEDITEQRRAEEELRKAQSDLARVNRVTTMGELTASLAHEVNQPITAAVTNAYACLRWLAEDRPDIEQARGAAMRVVKCGQHAGEIVSRIRRFFVKGSTVREPIAVNDFIREMIVLLRNETARSSISVRTDLAKDLPRIMGDRVQLQQVLMNLMINGIDAMKDVDRRRDLTIRSRRVEDGQLLVSVDDTGVGLPEQETSQIFNAFFTTKPHGTGMGLRISRSIIEDHGGRLWATANSPRGARFFFTLPTPLRVTDENVPQSHEALI